jgi:hypothetical protein
MPSVPTNPDQPATPAVIASATGAGLSHQEAFQRRWPSLRDPHVRALAWLLDAPDLLDVDAPRWQGRIAALGPLSDFDVTWLYALDGNPRLLHAHLGQQPTARLGRYAEQLMTFYLQQSGRLIAHNVQVRNGPNATIGEFDFLVHATDAAHEGAEHWEFATKFYLLESYRAHMQADAFVGPNLADSLGAKMDKIMQQQLLLSQHPAAAQYLTRPVTRASALVKGWLFYREADADVSLPTGLGVAAGHCRGFWCELAELDLQQAEHYLLLPRLEWLAPARAPLARSLSAAQLPRAIEALFAQSLAPVMIAVCALSTLDDQVLLEQRRGFIVPDDWRGKAAQRVQHAIVTY